MFPRTTPPPSSGSKTKQQKQELGLLVGIGSGSDMFLRNIGLFPNCTVLHLEDRNLHTHGLENLISEVITKKFKMM
jgi:hypothetical protein